MHKKNNVKGLGVADDGSNDGAFSLNVTSTGYGSCPIKASHYNHTVD